MKRILSGILCVAGIFIFSCSPLFPTNYERIDAERVRILDFIYEPAESSPLPTTPPYPYAVVRVATIFAGAGYMLNSQDINWKISYNVLSNNNGVDTALDIQDLWMFKPSEHYFSKKARRYVWTIWIPDSVIFKSASIPEDWISLVPEDCQSGLPEYIKALTKTDLISFVHNLAERAIIWGQMLTNNPSSEDSLLQADTLYSLYKNNYSRYLPALLQLLTIKIRLFADILGVQKVRSTYSIRYNSCFKDLPGTPIYVNNNPVIDSIGIYKVNKKDLEFFDPDDGKYEYEFIRLFGTGTPYPDSIQTVEVDKKCSYFVAGFAGEADSSQTLQSALTNGPPTVEQFSTQWYFQLDEDEIADVSPYDYMNITSTESFIELLHLPEDERVKTFTLWLEVSDYLLNEINRPQGSTLEEVSGRFTYTSDF